MEITRGTNLTLPANLFTDQWAILLEAPSWDFEPPFQYQEFKLDTIKIDEITKFTVKMCGKSQLDGYLISLNTNDSRLALVVNEQVLPSNRPIEIWNFDLVSIIDKSEDPQSSRRLVAHKLYPLKACFEYYREVIS